jgi:starch-binding outer membrane protein, SusD/RagB family
MKPVKIYVLYSCIMMGLLSLFSCDKNLDNANKTSLDDNTQWSTESNADIFLNDVYDQLPDIYSQPENYDNFTDDNDAGFYYNSWKWKDGNLDPASTNYALFGGGAVGIGSISRTNWPALYTSIRKCNTFIQQVTAHKANYSSAWFNKRIDEARFNRAFHYSILFLNWGGVPVITNPQVRIDTVNLFVQRST